MQNNINLAPSEAFEKGSFWDKVYVWGTNAGKIIILLTNFVILSVWLYRWNLDRQIFNLAESVENKQVAILSVNHRENYISRIQSKISAIKEVENNKPYYSTSLLKVEDTLTNAITINKMAFASDKRVNIDATAADGRALAVYLSRLMEDNDVFEIILYQSFLNPQSREYVFNIEVGLR